MAKKTIALITGLVLLTILLVFLAIQTSKPQTTTVSPVISEKPATPTSIAKAKLFMTPNPVSLKGITATLSLNLDANQNNLTSVQMELSYDPRALSFVSLTPTSQFVASTPILNNVDKRNGRITYALGFTPEQSQAIRNGQTEIATIEFVKTGFASASASTDVNFLPKSVVSAKGISQSVLGDTQGATILLTPVTASHSRVPPPARISPTK